MQNEIVEGYTITDRLVVSQKEFVIGENPEAEYPFVTWQRDTNLPGLYHWRHGMDDRLSAIEDLCRRALDHIAEVRLYRQTNGED